MRVSDYRAIHIATAHLSNANPTRWNGAGPRPASFITFTRSYFVDSDTTLEISYMHEPNIGYRTLYQLVNKKSNYIISKYKSKYICNPNDMAKDILHVCNQ